MDNKELPQEEVLLPQEGAPTPPAPEPVPPTEEVLTEETLPEIQELTFHHEAPEAAEESAPVSQPEEAPVQEVAEETATEAEEEAAPMDLFHDLPLFQAASGELEQPVTEELLPELPGEIPSVPEETAQPEPETAEMPTEVLPASLPEEVPVENPEEMPVEIPLAADVPVLPQEQEEEPLDQEYRDNSGDFQEIFDNKPEQKPSANRHSIARKGRPKRKKGEGLLGIPNILATFVWLALILAIGVTAGRMLWVCAADVLAFGREDKPVTITIYEADDMEAITNKLYDAGLIRYKSLFNLYASISDAEEDIKPGIYDLNTLYDYHALVNFMTPRSSREVIELTIPEGYSCRQIFALLEENRVCTAVDVAAYAADGELDDYWFLEGLERGTENCLEGYLFPDTYEFYKNSTPREALQKMLNNFDYRFSEEMRGQIDTLNANVTGGGYTVRDVVIVASLIEKESAAAEESDKIAGVIYNRLFRWEGVPAYLNIDAAIVYAQGGDAEYIDTGIDSPYNTYTHVGLTPGPIANPGLSSLKAALNPASHNYYYYVLNPATGRHQFSTTLEEHNAYVDQFRAG